MNTKRLILAILACTILFQGMDFLIHNVILGPTYQSLASVWRPNMNEKMWMLPIIGLVSNTVWAIFFATWTKFRGLAEGLKFGILTGLLVSVIGFGQYVVYPIPFSLAAKWFGFNMLEFALGGMLLGLIYKPAQPES